MIRTKRKVTATGIVIFFLIILFAAVSCSGGAGGSGDLPKPEITGGARGELGIDRNINEASIDEYLGRPDAVYRDMRMLEDPAEYENIGGDSYLSGYVEGFEIVPLPYIIPVYDLPHAVGQTYSGDTLFSGYGTYVPNYEESMDIIEELFPKDKVIFLMCGGGGYAGMTKNFLITMGWDPDKIYVVGGYWFYDGEHSVEVKKEENGETVYDFDSVPYHDIDFSTLTPAGEYEEQETAVTGIWLCTDKLELEEDTSFQLKAIVLPNEATTKDVTWTSSDSSVAYMSGYGLVRGVNPGTATVTVETSDGGFSASCEVTVTERKSAGHVALDDLTAEAEVFAANDPDGIMHEISVLDSDLDKAVEDGYYVFDGEGYMATDLWRDEYDRHLAKAEEAIGVRTEILNKLVDGKHSFILLVYTKDCEGREYHATEGAERLLKVAAVPYFYTYDAASGYDRSLLESRLDYQKVVRSSIVIFKDGEIYAGLDPDMDSIKSDEELKNWLEKYIDLD